MSLQPQPFAFDIDDIIQDAQQQKLYKIYLNGKYQIAILHTTAGGNNGNHLWFINIKQRIVYSSQESNGFLIEKINNNNNNSNIRFCEVPQELSKIFASFDYFLFHIQPYYSYNQLQAADFGSKIKYKKMLQIAQKCKSRGYDAYHLNDYQLAISIYSHASNALRNYMRASQYKETTSMQQKEARDLMGLILYLIALCHFDETRYDKCIVFTKECLTYTPNMEKAQEIKDISLNHVERMRQLQIFDHFGKDTDSTSTSPFTKNNVIYSLHIDD